MRFTLRDFAGDRRVFRCASCAQTSVLPLRSRLIAIPVAIAISAVEMFFLRIAGLVPTANTSLSRLFLFLLLFLGAVFIAGYCSVLASQMTAGRLVRDDHPASGGPRP